MATRRPARESASKRVSQVSVGLSDFRMPWVSGGAPVNIDAKQTGVTEGITAHASTDVGAWRANGSKTSAYERTRCAPIASAANTSAFVTVRFAANAATSLNGGATQSAGLGIPKRSHTVLVTDATSSMPRVISDSSGRNKGSRHPVDVTRRSKAVLGKFAISVGQAGRAYLRLMGDGRGSGHHICGHSSSRKGKHGWHTSCSPGYLAEISGCRES